jgi:type IV secretory pathway TrbD component
MDTGLAELVDLLSTSPLPIGKTGTSAPSSLRVKVLPAMALMTARFSQARSNLPSFFRARRHLLKFFPTLLKNFKKWLGELQTPLTLKHRLLVGTSRLTSVALFLATVQTSVSLAVSTWLAILYSLPMYLLAMSLSLVVELLKQFL